MVAQGRVPYLQFATHAFNNLPSEDMLREMLVDTERAYYDPLCDDEVEIGGRDDVPPDSLMRTVLKYSARITERIPILADRFFSNKSNIKVKK